MPALSRPVDERVITLPPREAMLAADVDVLVVGGGPAGLGAALGAAKTGARVVLVERYGATRQNRHRAGNGARSKT